MEKLENPLCLDTDILVDLLRNDSKTIKWFKDNENKFDFFTSMINIFELYAGAYKSSNSEKKLKDVEDLINRLQVLDFSIKSAKESGKQRALLEKQGILVNNRDIFIGSIALTEKIPLKTNNKKHFSRIKGLEIID